LRRAGALQHLDGPPRPERLPRRGPFEIPAEPLRAAPRLQRQPAGERLAEGRFGQFPKPPPLVLGFLTDGEAVAVEVGAHPCERVGAPPDGRPPPRLDQRPRLPRFVSQPPEGLVSLHPVRRSVSTPS